MKKFTDFVAKTVVESLKESVDKEIKCNFVSLEEIAKPDLHEGEFAQVGIESVKPAEKFFMLIAKDIAELLVDGDLTDESLEDLMFQFSFDFVARYDEVTNAEMGWQISSSSIDAKLDTVYENSYLLMIYDINIGGKDGKWLWIIKKQFVQELSDKLPSSAKDKEPAHKIDVDPAEPAFPAKEAASNAADRIPSISQNEIRNLDVLMDINLQVVVRIGTKEMLLKDILELVPGSNILLSQNIEDPLDILVNGKVVATGKAVSIDGFFGVKITSIVSKISRLEGLQQE